jgi:hypothetical protein
VKQINLIAQALLLRKLRNPLAGLRLLPHSEARIRKGRADTFEAQFNALKAAAPD